MFFMKHQLLAFATLTLSIACSSSKESKMDYSEITFFIDTVMVDSKDEILFLGYSLSQSDFSEDQNYLYNFNMNDHSVEVIDMNSLKFVERKNFEKEGPNGIGEYIGTLHLVGEDSFFFTSFQSKGIYDFNGKKIKALNHKSDDIAEAFYRGTNQFYNTANGHLMGNYADWDTGKKFFGIADTEQKSFKRKALERFDFLENYSTWLVSEGGGKLAQSGHWTIPALMNNKVIISTNITADFYVYDMQLDSLSFVEFDHKLFPKLKSGTFPKETSSPEEYRAIRKNYLMGINFHQPIWDKENKVYYRFSYVYSDSEAENPPATVYLTILDESFQIINETEVPALNKRPNYHFPKGGKIWMFENIDDELGFIRISFLP
jgi:hypothetical protein